MNLDQNAFIKLLNANVFIDLYNRFLGLFPASMHWLVSLLILAAIVVALIVLISSNVLFIVIAIILLPVLYPILRNLLLELYSFILYLWHIISVTFPQT